MNSKKIVGVVGYCLLIVSLQALNVRAVEFFTKQNSQFNNGYISTKTLILIVGIVTFFYLKAGYIDFDYSAILHPGANIKKELKIASIAVVIIIVGLIACRLVLQMFKPEVAERPFFGLYFWYHTRWFYPINSFLQECFIRLIIQDNLMKLEDETTTNSSLMLTAFFFCSLHMAYPWYMMLGTVLYCLVTGYLYKKYRCLYGLSIIHFTAGFLPRCFGII